jgi:hypothetical protein
LLRLHHAINERLYIFPLAIFQNLNVLFLPFSYPTWENTYFPYNTLKRVTFGEGFLLLALLRGNTLCPKDKLFFLNPKIFSFTNKLFPKDKLFAKPTRTIKKI